jgi:hypothetical protein
LSDTCDLTIRIHPSHEAAAVAAFGVEPAERQELADRPRPLCLLVFDDVAPDDGLAELARQHITFDGSHGNGADYPGRRFASFGGELAAVDQPFSVVSVPIDLDTLSVDEAALDDLRAYKRLRQRAEDDFDREPPACDVPLAALHLEEVGQPERWNRLLGSIAIGGIRCHVEALAVQNLEHQHVAQEALADEFHRAFALLSDGFNTETGFQTWRLEASDGRDHEYVVFIYPHDK